eukprot:EG_transcript_9735
MLASAAAEGVDAVHAAGRPGEPSNNRLLRVARGEPVDRVPVWLFRQAGPYLPEYNRFKADRRLTFFDIVADPEACAEVAMQPLRRYGLDAAILFSDILVVAQALGVAVTLGPDGRIHVPQPLRPEDVPALPSPAELDEQYVDSHLGHVLAAVRATRQQLHAEGFDVPLLGFSGAPWTLFHYMVGATSTRNTDAATQWAGQHCEATEQVLDALTALVVAYLCRQVDCGAHALQLFDSMCGTIDAATFEAFALPRLQRIAAAVRRRHPTVPLLVFARGANYAVDALCAAGYDVVTLDPAADRAGARAVAAARGVSLQGNFDPHLLHKGAGTAETVRQEARRMLQELGPQRLVANLGEGLMGREDPDLVGVLVEELRAHSRDLMAAPAP